jgi:signal transduction histidine kinase
VRVMGQLARQRARPWLAAASLALLLVSLLVSAILWWAAMTVREYTATFTLVRAAPWADLVISLLIATSVTLTGQAIVSYEVFIGKALPRRGLQRYWHRALILASGYSLLVSLSLVLNLPSIYILLLSACLLVLFYALLSWRSYAERERFIADLRPFIASSQLYDRLLAAASPGEMLDMQQSFCALCENVLGARLGYLAPLGSLAPLFGPPLAYPTSHEADRAQSPEWIAQAEAELGATWQSAPNPHALCMPLDPQHFGGAVWAVPLWSERGLCGLLLLGEKQDGGLYTQEEIEVARSAGERLVDLQASAEMARRLMALQRQRLVESQVGDRRARRSLHDDILPRLHAAMLALSSLENAQARAMSEPLVQLSEIHHQLSDLLRELPTALPAEVTRLGLAGALEEVAQGELKHAFDEVSWQAGPQVSEKARRLPALAQEVLFYAGREAMRNAARHARAPHSEAPLCLKVSLSWKDGLVIQIEDNGVGFKTLASPAASGHGLALHSTLMAVVGGSLSVESLPGAYTRVQLYLPEGQEQSIA